MINMLIIDNITKRHDNVEIVREVSLKISSGEILALVGPSGCGKTTLLRMVAGFEHPDDGRILINGEVVSTRSSVEAPYKRGVSMIFQDLALWPHMRVREHIEFVLRREKLSRHEASARIDRILNDVNLNGYMERYPHQLSGGEKQRLAIARGIASTPSFLLMDEPFSSLDSIVKEELQELVIKCRDHLHAGIIYVTHNIEEALELADRIAIMNKGVIEQEDSKEMVIGNPRSEFVSRLLKLSKG